MDRKIQYDPNLHHRRSIRLTGYDYTQSGAYFITIITSQRACLFGDILDGEMILNEFGHVAKAEWIKTSQVRASVKLGAYVVMPNHLHGILLIMDEGKGSARRTLTESYGKPVSGSLSSILRSYKSAVTKEINERRSTPGLPVWQRNYYEHIIRDERSFQRISEYIVNNPVNWNTDDFRSG